MTKEANQKCFCQGFQHILGEYEKLNLSFLCLKGGDFWIRDHSTFFLKAFSRWQPHKCLKRFVLMWKNDKIVQPEGSSALLGFLDIKKTFTVEVARNAFLPFSTNGCSITGWICFFTNYSNNSRRGQSCSGCEKYSSRLVFNRFQWKKQHKTFLFWM